MSVRSRHVPIDRLTALAFVARAPEPDDDEALVHVSQCRRCARQLAQLTSEADHLRDAAFAQADAIFDEALLDAQRTRILDRLANLGHVARVLRFPHRTRDAAMPVSGASRRWISVAAAAGLIIGLVAGQLIHFVPWSAARRDGTLTIQVPARQNIVSSGDVIGPSVADDEFLYEIEATVQLRRAHSLRALDTLTPTASDFGPR